MHHYIETYFFFSRRRERSKSVRVCIICPPIRVVYRCRN